MLSGYDAFTLYSSYGFPIELIEEIAAERKINVDRVGFEEEVQKHKEKSRKGAEKKFGGHGLALDTGELRAGSEKEAQKVIRLHTATHLLHTALRKKFGESVEQRGSDITPERLRFDFTLQRKMTDGEKKEIEDEVNKVIDMDLDVTMEEMSYEDAIETGALSFFREKYPDRVKVYSIGDYSKELCGGPHIKHTGEIGKFKILKEESVSAGVRRIRADVE
jgi:alanyl-tRNA synthetase